MISKTTLVALAFFSTFLLANPQVDRARQLMRGGNPAQAKTMLEQALRNDPQDAEANLALAEYLDQHRQAGAIEAYRKAAAVTAAGGRKAAIERRIAILEAMQARPSSQGARNTAAWSTVTIPGPLRSFARMAALSPDLPPDQVLVALSHNVMTNGYQASGSEEGLQPTEYLKLVYRYLTQARELERLSGESKMIKVPACDSNETGELLKVIGYRMRGSCGGDVVLETVNASRAFLTIDSGFPLAELEQALRRNEPFTLDYHRAEIPVLFESGYWLDAASTLELGTDPKDKAPKAGASPEKTKEFIDQFMGDPQTARLYLGLAKLDGETAESLRKNIAPAKLRAFSHVLDFYGGMFEIRNGKAVIQGGPVAAKAWSDIVGVSTEKGPEFFEKLLAKDDGWLASYFDAVSRIEGPVRDYLLNADRCKRYYTAIRGRITSPGPARPVFRSNTDMIMLTTRLRLEADGRPHIPGGMEVWKNLFIKHPNGRYDGKLTKLATGWKEPDDLVEALFALTRKVVDNEPLKMYMEISDINRHRAVPLQAATVERMLLDFRRYNGQYGLFAEFPQISDGTIIRFLEVAASVDKIGDQGQRSDAAGIMQGLVSLWQIAARQGLLPKATMDATLLQVLDGLKSMDKDEAQLDAGRAGIKAILAGAGMNGKSAQQDLMELLSGGTKDRDDTQQTLVTNMNRLFDSQRLVSLDVLFDLDDDLVATSKGGKFNVALANKLSQKISEVSLPRPALSAAERNVLSFGYYVDRHVEAQRRFNLRQRIEKAQGDSAKLAGLRGELAPILRDTIIGFSYVFYAPPGAQVLVTNPLFVRSHDFIGMQTNNVTWRPTEVYGTGWPSSAGGRLLGSMSALPYALAEAEQNFLVPSREQALIWGDLVPQMIITAKVPRWWNVTRTQLHYVNLAMQLGEEEIADGLADPVKRERVMADYSRLASPVHVDRVRKALINGNFADAIVEVQPSELYLLGMRSAAADRDSLLAAEVRAIQQSAGEQISAATISRTFGTPKPTLLHNFSPELLGLRTFPTLMGYSSRIMAESWESNLLYFAALADDIGAEPSQLNLLVPEWTAQTVERIFATHLEDWPALLRSLRQVGDRVRNTAKPGGAARAAVQ